MRAVAAPPFGTVALHGSAAGDTVAYASYGPEEAPAVFVLGGISAHRFVCGKPDGTKGWWPGVVGPGVALDPERYRIVGIDWLGGAGDSGGPSPIESGLPVVTTEDQAHAVAAVLDHLEIEKLHGFVGASYGGMVGLALGVLYPERVERLLLFCAAHRSHPMAVGLRVLQRRIVALSVAAGRETEGLALARALAMTTYRTPEEFEQRFVSSPSWEDGLPRFAVENTWTSRARGSAVASTRTPSGSCPSRSTFIGWSLRTSPFPQPWYRWTPTRSYRPGWWRSWCEDCRARAGPSGSHPTSVTTHSSRSTRW